MREKFIKLIWVWKLLRAKGFVVMTEKESIIAVAKGEQPESLQDAIAVAGQEESLKEFRDNLDLLIERHENQFSNLIRTEKFMKGDKVIAQKATLSRTKAKKDSAQ